MMVRVVLGLMGHMDWIWGRGRFLGEKKGMEIGRQADRQVDGGFETREFSLLYHSVIHKISLMIWAHHEMSMLHLHTHRRVRPTPVGYYIFQAMACHSIRDQINLSWSSLLTVVQYLFMVPS